jgi:hypothetical protein
MKELFVFRDVLRWAGQDKHVTFRIGCVAVDLVRHDDSHGILLQSIWIVIDMQRQGTAENKHKFNVAVHMGRVGGIGSSAGIKKVRDPFFGSNMIRHNDYSDVNICLVLYMCFLALSTAVQYNKRTMNDRGRSKQNGGISGWLR